MSQPQLVAITGASGGIGRELSRQLAAKGFRVGLIARRQAELEAAVKECGGEKTACFAVADVTDKDQAAKALDSISKSFNDQPIDILINNAGRGLTQKPSEATVDQIDDMMKVNVHSVLFTTSHILPQMKKRKTGQIVNVSSVLGRVAENAPQRCFYSGAKHFLNAYTESLREELRQDGFSADKNGIVISTVSPGPVASDFGTNAGGGSSKDIPGVQSVESCCQAIVDLVVNRKEECYTDPSWYKKVNDIVSKYGKPE